MNITRRQWLAGAGSLSIASRIPFQQSAPPSVSSPLPDRNNFTVGETLICLNNARWHPTSIPSMRAIQEYLDFKTHGAIEPRDRIADMQDAVKVLFAKLINARYSEISYVPSTMVGENIVLAGLGIPASGGNVITEALHFQGSIYLYRSLEKQGLDLRMVMPREWRIDLRDIEKVIDHKTKLIALSLVSYLNGFQHDLKAVCDLAHAHGAYVYADIVQAAGAVPFDVRASGVDFCACSSYKWLMGDMGVGFLYVREDLIDTAIRRTQFGHRQYSNFQDHLLPLDPPSKYPATWTPTGGAGGHFEVGTVSNTTVACLSHSLKYIQELGVENIQAHAQSLTARLQKELPRLGFESLTPPDSRSPIVTVVVKEPEIVAARLGKAGIDVKIEEHHMRISPSVYNDEHDIEALLECLS